MVISGTSQLLAQAPFLYIWAILRDVLAGDYSRIGRKDATDEEVIAAARLAHVDVFAERLSQVCVFGPNCDGNRGLRAYSVAGQVFFADLRRLLRVENDLIY